MNIDTESEKLDLSFYYGLFTYLGYGGDVEDFNKHLGNIKKLLAKKYGDQDYRVKYMAKCILKTETHELETEDREWIRYILHAEDEPENEQHQRLLAELKERMEKP